MESGSGKFDFMLESWHSGRGGEDSWSSGEDSKGGEVTAESSMSHWFFNQVSSAFTTVLSSSTITTVSS